MCRCPRVNTATNWNVQTEIVVARAVHEVVIRDANIHTAIARAHATDIDPVHIHHPLTARANPVAAPATLIRKRKVTIEATATVVAANGATVVHVLVHMIVAAPIIGIVNFLSSPHYYYYTYIYFFLFPIIAIVIFKIKQKVARLFH